MKVLIYVFFLFFFIQNAYSAQVAKVKGAGVLIKTEGDDLKIGQLYYLVQGGKKKGIVRVLKLKNNLAIAKLLKGSAQASWTLVERSPKSKSTAPSPSKVAGPKINKKSKPKRSSSFSDGKISVGGLLGYSMNSASVTFSNRAGSYSGSDMSFQAFGDYKITDRITALVSLGMQNFSAEQDETDLCPDANNNLTQTCVINLSYINLDLWGKYYFVKKNKLSVWGGAGLAILISSNFNDTTALDEDAFGTTMAVQVGGGLDYQITDRLYIPIMAEYGYYPSTDTVDMNAISGFIGLGYRL